MQNEDFLRLSKNHIFEKEVYIMKEKVVGILGGMGPEATIDIFAKITKETKAKKNEDYLRVIIDSNPKMPSRQKAILEGTKSPGPAMAETAVNLEKAGADFIIIAANTAHYFFDDVKNAVNIPVLHIINEAIKETTRVAPNIKKIGILASSGATRSKIYNNACDKFEVSVLDVPKKLQKQVQKSIYSFIFEGRNEKNVKMMVNVADYLINQGAEALVMGCTEIPLIIGNMKFNIPLIDPNEIIAKVAVKFAKNEIRIRE